MNGYCSNHYKFSHAIRDPAIKMIAKITLYFENERNLIVPALTFDNIIYATVVGIKYNLFLNKWILAKNKSSCFSVSLINMSIKVLCFYNNKALGVRGLSFFLGDF